MEQQMLELKLFSPVLTLSLGAVVILLGASCHMRERFSNAITSAFLLLAVLAAVNVAGLVMSNPALLRESPILGGYIFAGPYSAFVSLLIAGAALLAYLIGVQHLARQGIERPDEFNALFLFATAGALLFATAADLVTLFIALEIMSLALYALCGSALGLRNSAESALKYFLLGSFSSALFLYGVALIYGLTGSTGIASVQGLLEQIDSPLLLAAVVLIVAGLIFKIGAVPFHFWVPDVYQGAPTSVTAYMACTVKVAAMAAALRVLWVALGAEVVFWSELVSLTALLTIVAGSLIALRQRSLKRLLAYSSIAHAGYMMLGFLARGAEQGGGAAVLYYLIAYTAMTLGAFAVVLAIQPADQNANSDDFSYFHGLSRRRPVLSLLMALFMFALAGLPPGMAGLLGKFYVFNAALRSDYVYLVVAGVLCSAISCYYYLSVVVAMYFKAPDAQRQVSSEPVGAPMAVALTLSAVGVLFFGLFPSLLQRGAALVIESL